MAEILQIHPETPEKRKVEQVVQALEKGAIIIYPTDTIYGIGCDATNARSIERLCKIKGIKPKKAQFAIICDGLSHIADYAKIDNSTFKLMKKSLPGPFTFILKAQGSIGKLLNPKKKEIGIRIPENNIIQDIVEAFGKPIVTSSLKQDDEIKEHPTEVEEIEAQFGAQVDLIIDGGPGGHEPSTIVQCTDDVVEIIREGKGDIHSYI